MCGIFGYVGSEKKKNAVEIVLEGIKRLEYRGYDSAGVVTIVDNTLVWEKEPGKIAQLEQIVSKRSFHSCIAAGHTRWATHGAPTQVNAHPQFDSEQKLAILHNGIIENHENIRKLLEKRGVRFVSETDTEVVSQLIALLYRGNLLKAVKFALPFLKGAFALCVVHEKHPDQMICFSKECPLAIGVGQEQMFVSSDALAFVKYTNRALYLQNEEIAQVTKNFYKIFNAKLCPVQREPETLEQTVEDSSKGAYEHYMLKEIFEQPQCIRQALSSRYSYEFGTALLEGLMLSEQELSKIKRILIVACGSSYHAGLLASYMIEEKVGLPCEVHISSEFRYKNPIVSEHTLAIAISQSGETADTLAAMRELKKKGAKIVGICNVLGSALAREVDFPLFLRAGPEIGVASTKAFTSQLTLIALLTLLLGRTHRMSRQEGGHFLEALLHLPLQIKTILDQHEEIQRIAKQYAHYENFFFLGRRFMYPVALESALKLKEIAYVNANGYPAGEMKHGPIALINPECPTVAFCSDGITFDKMVSNLMEIRARKGQIFAVSDRESRGLEKVSDSIFYVPKTIDELAPLLSTIVGQLFAYYVALARKLEIDQPRNLAKSVTVE